MLTEQFSLPLLHESPSGRELSLKFDNTTLQSVMDTQNPNALILDYTQIIMGFLLWQPTPSSICMIGLGGGSIAKYCHQTLPRTQFTTVENSPEIIKLRQHFKIPPDSDYFQILQDDGADFIARTNHAFDAIILDGFSQQGQPPQLSSENFYSDCHNALTKEGVLAVNLCTDDPLVEIYLERINRTFEKKTYLVYTEDKTNLIAFTSKTPLPFSFNLLSQRLRQLEAHHPNIGLERTTQHILRQI